MDKAEQIRRVEDGIRKYAPVMAEFFDREESVLEYSERLYDYECDPVYLERQKEFAGKLKGYADRTFNASPGIQLPLVMNIVDHQCILNHPILLATNIIAQARLLAAAKADPAIMVSTSSLVPADNFFSKGGFQYHGKKVPVFSQKDLHYMACFTGLRQFDFTRHLKQVDSWDKFDPKEQEFLEDMESRIQGLDFSRAKNYNDQVSIINHFLWKLIFQPDMAPMIPDLFYYPDVDMVRDCISGWSAPGSLLGRALFDEEFRGKVLTAFDGLTGCWNKNGGKGTHFFWYRSETNRALPLWLSGNKLISQDGEMTVELEPGAIKELLDEGKIAPNLFVICSLIVFWYGVRPLVGFGSVNYVTRMKQAWLEALTAPEDQAERSRIDGLDTKSLIGGAMVTYKRDNRNIIQPQYAFDVISDGGLSAAYLDQLFSMKFRDILRPALLDIYRSYVPAEQRIELTLEHADLMAGNFEWVR